MSASSPLLLRNPAIRFLWIGQVLSQAGTRMFQIAITWWLLSRGNGSVGLRLALFLVLCALPGILLAKKIGHWLHLHPTRSLLLASDGLAFFVTLGLLIFWDRSGVFSAVLATGLLLSFFQSIIDPGLNKAV